MTESSFGFKIDFVQQHLGHCFTDPALLRRALTHSSYANEKYDASLSKDANNERLEFLGDAVLGLCVAQELMILFPEANEGTLSRWRSSLVSRKSLAELATEMELNQFLLLGKGEHNTGGGEKRSILAGVFEAVIGALFVDGGIEAASLFIKRAYQSRFQSLLRGDVKLILKLTDKKTVLQEKTQERFKAIPTYRVTESWGLEHEKYFRVEISIGKQVVASGEGRSKKEAEQRAASVALERLESL